MNVFRKAANDYFAVRRALGFKLVRSEKMIAQFITYLEKNRQTRITMEMALAWATLPQAGQTWAHARLSVVRRFVQYMRSIDPATEVPPIHILAQNKGPATPYMYSRHDLDALVDATQIFRSADRALTINTLIKLLFCDGHAY